MAARKLLLVESPTKAKKIQEMLGANYKVLATMGHIIDLPSKELAVDVDDGFRPNYQVMPDKQQVVARILEAARGLGHDDIIIMTDDDREGAAIGWFIAEKLGLKDPLRGVFHEVTEAAIQKAITSPGHLDMNLVNAQQARRILDRLVGYKTTPILWQKLPNIKESSAGRVQSVALRLVVDRENERRNFVPKESWSVHAIYENGLSAEVVSVKKGGKAQKLPHLDKPSAEAIKADLTKAHHTVVKTDGKKEKGNPPAPLITSTMLQLASSKLRLGAEVTQKLAQELFEKGHITYHRTDSTMIAPEAQAVARDHLKAAYGADVVPAKANQYAAKSNAQGAHEAIRPTKLGKAPLDVSGQALELYNLIARCFLASQCKPAEFQRTTITLECGDYGLRASGRVLSFDGYLRVLGADDLKELTLPMMGSGEVLPLKTPAVQRHMTKPSDRFSEATLIKYLEDKGIGRPSTYAAIVSKIRQKDFVTLDGKHLVPTPKGETIDGVLRVDFPSIIREDFTAALEDRLDQIAAGKLEWTDLLDKFWKHFKQVLAKTNQAKPGEKACPACGAALREMEGKFGKFYSCANYRLSGCRGKVAAS